MSRIAVVCSLALAAALAAAAVLAADAPAAGPSGLSTPLALNDRDNAAALDIDSQGPVLPRPTALISGGYIRLSDLFEGVPPALDAVIGPAPRPGDQIVFPAEQLAALARQHGLQWQPDNPHVRVTAARDTQIIGRRDILEALRPHLVDEGVSPQADIVLSSPDNAVPIAAGTASAVGVLDLDYNATTQRFTALVEIPAGSPSAQRQRIGGRVHLTTAVPVLVRSVGRGELVGPNDITWMTVRVDQLKRDTIMDPEQLIGRTPRRFVQAGAAVHDHEIERPRLIDKGAIITMIYKTPYMQLTAQGRALDHGGMGDQVRVQNLQSNQTVTAIITDRNLVTVHVGPPPPSR
ncbi:flagellar basal body P-ring formation chaperone FlgA [Caenispirillum bisanense]|uniref:flagellar basal body P-ring formation chaperone FlgA n=1 Tax=Caenispirillum bisanense TaxID=414052 RepID=UPI0031DA3901